MSNRYCSTQDKVVFFVTLTYLLQSNSSSKVVAFNGKAIPLQAWSGPEDFRKLRYLYYMTTVQDGGKVVRLKHWPPLTQGSSFQWEILV